MSIDISKRGKLICDFLPRVVLTQFIPELMKIYLNKLAKRISKYCCGITKDEWKWKSRADSRLLIKKSNKFHINLQKT